jgi:hypothetical protein
MPYILLTISDDFPKTGSGQGTVTELSDHDLTLSPEEFTRRITLPMTHALLDRYAPNKPVSH